MIASNDGMRPTIEADMSENARLLAVDAATRAAGESAKEARQRAEGEFLRKLVAELQPMLRESMRSHRIVLATNDLGYVALTSHGTFVHIGIAEQEDALEPMQVLMAEPRLARILDRIEAELVAANDPRATSAADVVRIARYSLEADERT